MSPKFSPDGKRLIFTGPESGLWFYDLQSGKPELLIAGPRAVVANWSYSGKFLTYTAAPEGHTSYVVIYDLAREKNVREIRADGKARIGESSLSPDDKFIAYTYQGVNEHKKSLAIQSLVTDERKILDLPYSVHTPEYSPNGKYIAYRAVGKGVGSEIFLFNTVTGETKQLTRGDGALPAWRRDSSGIVFTSDRDGGDPQIYSIELPK